MKILSQAQCGSLHAFSRIAQIGLAASGLALFAICAARADVIIAPVPPPTAPPHTEAVSPPQGTPVYASAAPGSAPALLRSGPGEGMVLVVNKTSSDTQGEVMMSESETSAEWIPGYWAWQGNRYVWQSGHWEMPPREGAVWVQPRWEREGTGYRFYEGYWR